MITPAKWQAKGGDKNEKFRKDIIPYMSKIIYFPYTNDVFDVTSQGGITYYLIGKQKIGKAYLDIKKKTPGIFIKEGTIDYNIGRKTLYDEDVEVIISKACGNGFAQLKIGSFFGTYKVVTSHLYCGSVNKINCLVVCPMSIDTTGIRLQNTFAIYASNSERECKSFISYIKTKLVRFLMLPSISSGSINNLEAWRFVPDPGAFDHIFTDQELYQKYGLTPDEIAIIESVIKERK